jgi:hypothetical protein
VIQSGYKIEFSSRKQLDRQKKKEQRESPAISDHLSKKQMVWVNGVLSKSCCFNEFQKSGAPGGTRTHDILLRRQLSTLIRTCRSGRKARENQQLVINGDKLLTPFSSPLSRRFATICHNYYYISMTEKITGQSRYSNVKTYFSSGRPTSRSKRRFRRWGASSGDRSPQVRRSR